MIILILIILMWDVSPVMTPIKQDLNRIEEVIENETLKKRFLKAGLGHYKPGCPSSWRL